MSRFVVEVRKLEGIAVSADDVLPLTEAAQRLGVSPQSVIGLCESERLRRVFDMHEPNPQKRGRVLRVDVEKELAQRRERRDDSRLKVKRGRPPGS